MSLKLKDKSFPFNLKFGKSKKATESKDASKRLSTATLGDLALERNPVASERSGAALRRKMSAPLLSKFRHSIALDALPPVTSGYTSLKKSEISSPKSYTESSEVAIETAKPADLGTNTIKETLILDDNTALEAQHSIDYDKQKSDLGVKVHEQKREMPIMPSSQIADLKSTPDSAHNQGTSVVAETTTSSKITSPIDTIEHLPEAQCDSRSGDEAGNRTITSANPESQHVAPVITTEVDEVEHEQNSDNQSHDNVNDFSIANAIESYLANATRSRSTDILMTRRNSTPLSRRAVTQVITQQPLKGQSGFDETDATKAVPFSTRSTPMPQTLQLSATIDDDFPHNSTRHLSSSSGLHYHGPRTRKFTQRSSTFEPTTASDSSDEDLGRSWPERYRFDQADTDLFSVSRPPSLLSTPSTSTNAFMAHLLPQSCQSSSEEGDDEESIYALRDRIRTLCKANRKLVRRCEKQGAELDTAKASVAHLSNKVDSLQTTLRSVFEENTMLRNDMKVNWHEEKKTRSEFIDMIQESGDYLIRARLAEKQVQEKELQYKSLQNVLSKTTAKIDALTAINQKQTAELAKLKQQQASGSHAPPSKFLEHADKAQAVARHASELHNLDADDEPPSPRDTVSELDVLEDQINALRRQKEKLQSDYSRIPIKGGGFLARQRQDELDRQMDTVDSQLNKLKLQARMLRQQY
ncbi:hypothetical protein BZG36_02708 [Bifiguratus adelaidae]|uniref:Uncharacterized protein n=1 Tax=Bifiguratus adelaidae TaxID=1938954 RepID=A0A261Y1Q7_9FUNG|nr:hypothetical protein BZG36_02708 [Bifiguratus adelaidae]